MAAQFNITKKAGRTVDDIVEANRFSHVCRMNVISYCMTTDPEDRQSFLKMTSVLTISGIKISDFFEYLYVDTSVFMHGIDCAITTCHLYWTDFFSINQEMSIVAGV